MIRSKIPIISRFLQRRIMLSNPYHGETFFGFIWVFIQRLFSGQFSHLATDEIQIFVLAAVAISSALVGTFLVLRKMTMLANSLSHTILMGIVLAYFFSGSSMQALLIAAMVMGLVTTFLTEFLTKAGKLQEDASTGLVFTGLFAIGVVLVTILTRDAHIGTEAVMGNADALHRDDLFWVYVIVGVNLVLITLFFKEFQLTTFDPGLAYSLGFSPFLLNYLLMAQVSATTMTSFRAVGVILVLAFMTGPVLAARLLTHNLKTLLFLSALLGSVCSFIGVALARHFLTVYGMALSTSGLVVCTILVLYLAILFGKILAKKRITKTKVEMQYIEAAHDRERNKIFSEWDHMAGECLDQEYTL